jgi:hypothetical protein
MKAGPLAISVGVAGVIVGLLLGLAIGKGGGGPAPVTRSMLIVLHPKGGDCEAVFPNREGHVRRKDSFVWEIINTCGTPRTVNITAKKEGDTENVFVEPPPYKIEVLDDNANKPAESATLTIKDAAEYNKLYGYSVSIVGGKTYDPKLEVDP